MSIGQCNISNGQCNISNKFLRANINMKEKEICMINKCKTIINLFGFGSKKHSSDISNPLSVRAAQKTLVKNVRLIRQCNI